MTQREILFLSGKEIAGLLTWEEIIETCEATFRWVGEGKVEQRHIGPLSFSPQKDRTSFAMPFPAYLAPLGIVGVKWGGGSHWNNEKGLPWFTAQIILNEAESVLPIAVMDGTVVTSMRTGGHAAVGAKYMARNDSEIVAIIGCGVEGRSHLYAMTSLFKLKSAKVFDIDREKAEAYAENLGKELFLSIEAVDSPKSAVSDADIVCMCTNANEPLVKEGWIKAGCHVAATRAFLDLDPAFSRKADKWALGNWKIDSDWLSMPPFSSVPHLSTEDAYADLGEIVTGQKPARERETERTVMSHLGMGALDVAVGYKAYKSALERGIGRKLNIF